MCKEKTFYIINNVPWGDAGLTQEELNNIQLDVQVQCCSCFGFYNKELISYDEFLPEENHYESECVFCTGEAEIYRPQNAHEWLMEFELIDLDADMFESVDDAQGTRDADPFAKTVVIEWDDEDLPF